MTGTFEYGRGDKRALPDFNVFFRYHANYPFYSDAIWYLTQMRRWGQIPEAQAGRVVPRDREEGVSPRCVSRRPRSCSSPRRQGERGDFALATRRLRAPTKEFIDGIEYDGRKPNAYIEKLAIGLKGQQKIEGGNVVGK